MYVKWIVIIENNRKCFVLHLMKSPTALEKTTTRDSVVTSAASISPTITLATNMRLSCRFDIENTTSHKQNECCHCQFESQRQVDNKDEGREKPGMSMTSVSVSIPEPEADIVLKLT